jgi:hypothetical protein
MADHSYYEFTCPCGKQYQREHEETFPCICGRLLVLDWSGSKSQQDEPDSALASEVLPKAAA